MCNFYRIDQKPGKDQRVRVRIAEAAGRLASPLVRKSDPGVVLLAGGQVEVMRWGFLRSFNPAINNARSDKLDSGMWVEALRHEHRCVIPVSAFYEWGPAAGGGKQAHEFSGPDDDWLWIAGLWEPGGDLGPCYTMVTTAASPVMAPIHDRMPAVLRADEVEGYVNNQRDPWTFQPFTGLLAVTSCASPLTKPKDGGGQGELF